MKKLIAVLLALTLTLSAAVLPVLAEAPEMITLTDGETYGEGAVSFTLTVVDADENATMVTINTDETTVGAALVALGIVEGDETEYGLYIKTVNGITADYDVDGSYWAFYIDGEYALTGVDATDITAGSVYSLIVTK